MKRLATLLWITAVAMYIGWMFIPVEQVLEQLAVFGGYVCAGAMALYCTVRAQNA